MTTALKTELYQGLEKALDNQRKAEKKLTEALESIHRVMRENKIESVYLRQPFEISDRHGRPQYIVSIYYTYNLYFGKEWRYNLQDGKLENCMSLNSLGQWNQIRLWQQALESIRTIDLTPTNQ